MYLLLRVLIAAGFLSFGAADLVIGKAGFGLFVLSEMGLLLVIGRSLRASRQIDRSSSVVSLFKLWDRLPRDVIKTAEIPYSDGLTLDMYSRPDVSLAPTLIYVHPGSWMRGRPGRQARPLFHLLAQNGWVILDIRYPLSPDATFPEHLIGVKRAIAWSKSEGSQYGIDARRIAISGGSSGAHLAALAALTWDRVDLQPDFEDADVSVVACLPFYGIYDLLIRNPTRYDWPFVARYVMKANPTEEPILYRLGSPVDQVRRDAPPFLVVHGGFDSVVLTAESQHFAAALERAGAPVEYLEVGWAQHGFDAIASLRTRSVGRLCAAWLERIVRRDHSSPGT